MLVNPIETTSAEILGAELPLQQGNVIYHFRDGEKRVGHRDDEYAIRSRIGFCPQHNSSLPKDLTCRETLRLFAYLKGGIMIHEGESLDVAVENEVERRLNEVKFTSEEDADKLVSTYSGGMQRKVLIAMALLGDPEVVFLDGKRKKVPVLSLIVFWNSCLFFISFFLASRTNCRSRSIQPTHHLGHDHCRQVWAEYHFDYPLPR